MHEVAVWVLGCITFVVCFFVFLWILRHCDPEYNAPSPLVVESANPHVFVYRDKLIYSVYDAPELIVKPRWPRVLPAHV